LTIFGIGLRISTGDVMEHYISILTATRFDEDQKRIITALSEQNDFLLVGIEDNEINTIIKAERLKPNILLLDLQLSETDGPQLVRIIRSRSPSTLVIILNDKEDNILTSLALKAGISGFLVKETDIDKLPHVIRLAVSGGCYINASIVDSTFKMVTYFSQFAGQTQKIDENLTAFSSYERHIIMDIANGLSDLEIAKRLNFSEGTIKNSLTVIKRKINLKNRINRIQIVVFSLVVGLIRLDQLDIYKSNGQFLNDTIQC